MKCPYCSNDLPENVTLCPNCNSQVSNIQSNVTQEIIADDTNNEKNSELKKYLTIFIALLVIFLILVTVIVAKDVAKSRRGESNKTTTTTSEPIKVEISKNKGTYSGLEAPVNFGTMTIATYEDKINNIIKEVDVELVRLLEQTEIDEIVLSSTQQLNEEFMWVGVEYRTTLNNFAYLGDQTISPILDVRLYDGKYKNEFFQVNENYYTISPIVDTNVLPIKNGESANVRMVYQVPINQYYYLCFGIYGKINGCYNKF